MRTSEAFKALIMTLTLGWGGTMLSIQAHAESTLCFKRNLNPKKAANLNAFIVSTKRSCPGGYSQIGKINEAEDLRTTLLTVDGAGSGIDADTLDGVDSSGFATAADQSVISERVSDVESAQSELQSSITSHSNTLGILTSSLSGLDTRASQLEDESRIERVARVGVNGGDYQSITAALAAATGATAQAPWLIEVGPGTFVEPAQLVVPSHVHLRGSGKEQTIIKVAASSIESFSSASAMSIRRYSAVSDFTLQNTAATNIAVGLECIASEVEVEPESTTRVIRTTHVTNVGVRVLDNGSGSTVVGFFLNDCDARFDRISTELRNPGTAVYALYATADSDATVSDAELRVSTSKLIATMIGVYAYGSGKLDIRDSDIFSYFQGIWAQTGGGLSGGRVIVSNSRIQTEWYAVAAMSGTKVMLTNTLIKDSNTVKYPPSNGTVVCLNIIDEDTNTSTFIGC